MNKTKIDWATMSWNPVTGCRHGCPYCYARRTAHRFDAGCVDPDPLADGLHVLVTLLIALTGAIRGRGPVEFCGLQAVREYAII